MPPVVASGATGLDYYFRDHFKGALIGLLAVSLLVLLVACINVANLMLARGMQRRHELAVRLAIGAGRGRVVRQLLVESGLVLAGGLALAITLAHFGSSLVADFFASASGRFDVSFETPLDWRVLLFATLVAVLSAGIFGALPAWQTSDIQSDAALRSGSRSIAGPRLGTRRIFLAVQVALTLVILVAAGVFTLSVSHLHSDALHFDGNRVLNARLMPVENGGKTLDNPVAYYRKLLTDIRQIPGVRAANLSSFSPLVEDPYKEDIRSLSDPSHAVLQAPAEFVTGDFLCLMHIRIIEGRNFRSTEKPNPRTTIISQSVAARLFPEGHAIGSHIRFGSEPETRDLEVIGIVPDRALENPHERSGAFILLNVWQLPRVASWGSLQVEFATRAAVSATAVREAVHKAGRQQVFEMATMSQLRERSLLQDRLLEIAAKVYAGLGITFAAVGLFGLLTFFISSRERELAVRIALGASRREILTLVAKEAALLITIGTGAGLLIAYFAIPGAQSLSFGIPGLPLDVMAIAAAALSTS